MGQGEYESISKLVKRCLTHIAGSSGGGANGANGGNANGAGVGSNGGVSPGNGGDHGGLAAKDLNQRQRSPNSPFLGRGFGKISHYLCC